MYAVSQPAHDVDGAVVSEIDAADGEASGVASSDAGRSTAEFMGLPTAAKVRVVRIRLAFCPSRLDHWNGAQFPFLCMTQMRYASQRSAQQRASPAPLLFLTDGKAL